MIAFFTDLDNTLIYSHNRDIGTSKRVVEYLNGKQQSYMTDYSYEYLLTANWLNIVPVTTRTKEQYRRISCVKDFGVTNALVCNGGMLLQDGVENKSWSEETVNLTEGFLLALDYAHKKLEERHPLIEIYRPVPYMIYFKIDDPEGESNKLRDLVDRDQIDIQHDRRKVYLFASGVNKGTAVERYRNKFGVEIDIAAGDDWMDVEMLNKAKYAFASDKIAHQVGNKNLFILEENLISDQICEGIMELHHVGKI